MITPTNPYDHGGLERHPANILRLISELEGSYQLLKYMGFTDDMNTIEQMKRPYSNCTSKQRKSMTPSTNNNWFTSTSDTPYDRHYYTINNKRFDDYEQLRQYWWQQSITNQTVIIHDYKTQKRTSDSKGF